MEKSKNTTEMGINAGLCCTGEIHWHEGKWVPYFSEHYDGIILGFENLLPFTFRMKLEGLGPGARANMQQNMWRHM